MSRHYIGITSKGPMTLRNVRLAPTGEPEVLLPKDNIIRLTVNYADWLESGEVLTSASVAAENVTAVILSSPSDEGGSASMSFDPDDVQTSLILVISEATASDYGKIALTIGTGRETRKEIIRVRRPSLYTDEQFYRDYA